jgi:ankyrin repeat protein
MTIDELYRCIKRADLNRIEVALNEGVDVNVSTSNGSTLLILAAGRGNTAIGKLLIERGADLNARTNYSQSDTKHTPLSSAAMSGKPWFMKLLLDNGASLNASPFSCTFESYIDWLEKYSAVSPEQANNIRAIFEAEKQKRATQK